MSPNTMKQILLKFITYFSLGSFIYFLFLVIEVLSLYFEEFGFNLSNAIVVSFSSIGSVINFGFFISFILTTSHLVKYKFSLGKIFATGVIISAVFGGFIFFLSNNIVPDTRVKSFLNRYENAKRELLSSKEKKEKTKDMKARHVSMMPIDLIENFSDSLTKRNTEQMKIVSDLALKIPDSILQYNLYSNVMEKYGMVEKEKTPVFNKRDLQVLKYEIRINETLEKQNRKAKWEINKRYVEVALSLFLMCLSIVLGWSFKKQKFFLLVCVGVVVYSQILRMLTLMTDYFVNGKNFLSMIVGIAVILLVFVFFSLRLMIKKDKV
jgi:lipopolysaccharide export LptBFGC system permease protein LptF